MSMSEFKIGDIVERTARSWGDVEQGKQYRIVNIDSASFAYLLKIETLSGTPLDNFTYEPSCFKLVRDETPKANTITKTEFKIGDLVKLPTTQRGEPIVNNEDRIDSVIVKRAINRNQDYLHIIDIRQEYFGNSTSYPEVIYVLSNVKKADAGVGGDWFWESDLEHYTQPKKQITKKDIIYLMSEGYRYGLKSKTFSAEQILEDFLKNK